MAQTPKWLMGCGIGCGAAILILTLLVGIGYFVVRDSFRSFQYAEQTQKDLYERDGDISDACPRFYGQIDSSAIKSFLAVRHQMLPLVDEIEDRLAQLETRIDEYENQGKKANIWNVLNTVGKGLGAIPQMAQYVQARNEALLEQEMSLGEYAYLYITIYYAWLEKPLSDGPKFNINDGQWGGYNIQVDEESEDDHGDVIPRRIRQMTRRSRNMMRDMLENAVADLEDNPKPEYEPWMTFIKAEIKRIKEDRTYQVWQHEFPAGYAASLEPYRQQLDAAYAAMTHPLELMVNSQ